MKNKPTIAVDIDDVLSPYVTGLLEYYEDEYGIKIKYETLFTNNFSKILKLTPEEGIKRARQFVIDKQATILPMPGVENALKKLQKQYKVVIMSFRHTVIEGITLKWLDDHFKTPFAHIFFLGATVESAGIRTKAEVCKKINAKWLIDDSLPQIIEAAEVNINTILFGDYPWNQADTLPKAVKRAKNWDEVLGILL